MAAESEEIKNIRKEQLKNKKQKGEKRSFEDGDKNKKKFKKQKKTKKDDTCLSEEAEINEIEQSIEEDLNESDKNGAVKKKPSKRQLKRERAEQREAETKEASKQQASEKALNYISKWKHARSQWKFEKIKQIWLINNLLDDKYVPDDHFPTILEYFEGCKGLARKQLIDKAMAAIKKVEDGIEEDEEITETTEYKRARQLLQALPTET